MSTNECEHRIDIMGRHMDFIGQRADKAVVKDVVGVEEVEQEDGIIVNGVLKRVEHYTMSCPDCGGDGYYDQRGEVICEDCGVVISGDHQPVIPAEYGDADDSVGSSRGLEKFGGKHAFNPGTHEPSI